MLNALAIRLRALRWRAQRWLRRHPRVHRTLHAAGSMKGEPEAIARGVAIGLFVGLTPTVGFQTALMLAACLLLAGNFPMAFAASFVSNPFTTAPFYWGFHELGERVLCALPMISRRPNAWFLQGPGDELIFTVIGSLLIAGPVALLGYSLTGRFLAFRARQRARKRKRRKAE
ncbi:DUF2062 domain-containing protein [Spiribacter vilamensis]|uniref:DUF2062 domain-containing protein n=1 Tax=Spiribacter vilamensis TaxID=531306 RepID=A0A4Q8D0B9_9GAMM|nr:DUF2062 domain-containing protein [Spiribacter vilamensis]RZU98714.1 hypothetical protein EV698_0975 [Spiribacter vilamensis]TVO62261.1 DUF2062 domain-containing protein [Spiribacter vilamensis]